MINFKVDFSDDEKEVLKKHRIIFRNNERLYIFFENDTIPSFGVPREYSVDDFNFSGSSWKNLLYEFGNWFLEKTKNFSMSYLLEIKNSYSKKIFSENKEINFIGPLSNGLYINNNMGVFSWSQIVDLLNILEIKDKGYILVHFPFQREKKEIAKLIWLKEIILFYKFLINLGFKKDDSLEHIEKIKKLSIIYKKNKTFKKSLLEIASFSNPFFITSDSRQSLLKAICELKKMREFNNDFLNTIDWLLVFKKELYYENTDIEIYIKIINNK